MAAPRKRTGTLSDEAIARIVTAYHKGASIRALALAEASSYNTVRRALHRAEAKVRTAGPAWSDAAAALEAENGRLRAEVTRLRAIPTTAWGDVRAVLVASRDSGVTANELTDAVMTAISQAVARG